MEEARANSSQIIRKTLIRMYPGTLVYATMLGFMYMVDNIIAGNAMGPEAIAAVAIALPSYGMFLAFMNAIVHGTCLRITWAKGRANHEEFQRAFAGGITLAALFGLIFTGVILFFSEKLVLGFGGSKSSGEICKYSLLYLRFCAPMVFLSSISGSVRETIGVLGYQMERASLGLFNIICNVIVSVISVILLPRELKMAGLGIGSSTAAFLEFVGGLAVLKYRKIDARLKPVMLNPVEIRDIFKSGLPASLDNIIDCIALAIVNNIILTLIPGDALILSTVSIVNNIKKVVRLPLMAVGYDSSPLFGVFYAQRDSYSLKKAVRESLRMGMIVAVFFCIACFCATPVLTRMFGMDMTPDIQMGSFFVCLFQVGYLVQFVLTNFYESTERFGSSLMMASIPDSFIYPLMLIISIPVMGKTGLWLSFGSNPFVGQVIMIPVMMLLSRKNPTVEDRILRLKPHIINRSSSFEYEIKGTDENAVGISGKIQEYLEKNGKNRRMAYLAALSSEELAVDMIAHLKETNVKESGIDSLFDIHVFNDEDSIEILIRSIGDSYDPLDYDASKNPESKIGVRMIQKVAEKVTYTYVYKVNIVSIVLR
ncbi:MATE family efflux transporter [Oribacterium sp. P6A1]|uniref:MATE family efflux transporter n=1 Tax=Oribacterium sp. P6A1 TaxID=1410612 RepID=UPI00055ABFEC|nr:MATE family efflux transporter [Oribacterium sp. P6A1]